MAYGCPRVAPRFADSRDKLLKKPLQLAEPRTVQLIKPFGVKGVFFGCGRREKGCGGDCSGGHGGDYHRGASGVVTPGDALSWKQR
jgi:hypothetical protein